MSSLSEHRSTSSSSDDTAESDDSDYLYEGGNSEEEELARDIAAIDKEEEEDIQREQFQPLVDCDDDESQHSAISVVRQEPMSRHTRKWEDYKQEKRQMLEEGFYIDKSIKEKRKIRPGVSVMRRKKGATAEGKVLKLVAASKQVIVEWDDGKTETIGPQALKRTDSSSGDKLYHWRMIPKHKAKSPRKDYPRTEIGVRGFDFTRFQNNKIFPKGKDVDDFPYLDLFLHMYPGDIDQHLQQLSDAIDQDNVSRSKDNKALMANVSKKEYLTFLAIKFSASVHGKNGLNIYENKDKNKTRSTKRPVDIYKQSGMPESRFRYIQKYFVNSFHDYGSKKRRHMCYNEGGDPWYMIRLLLDGYNSNRRRTVASSRNKTFDEAMSGFRPRTTKLGNLPNLSNIPRKPIPVGTEIKVAACAVSG